MRKYYNNQSNENSLLKAILILKLLNIYYYYREKLSNQNIEYNKLKEDKGNKGANTNKHIKDIKNDDKQVKKRKRYKMSKSKNNLDIRRQKNHKKLNTIEPNNYLSTELRNLKLEIPVIIAECNVSIPLEHNIKLEEYILEVKGIKNQVYIINSRVFSLILPNSEVDLSKGKVFIEGVIKSTIEYNTVNEINNGYLSGDIKHITSFIPFKCAVIVNYSHMPILKHNKENKNYKINCYLKQAEVFTSSSYSNIKLIDNTFNLGKVFKAIHQKIILRLSVCLTQRQEVIITKQNN